MNDERRRGARETVSEGIRQGLGVLNAFKDALEETIREAREGGELSPDRAKGAMKDALSRAQVAAGEARERLDFVPRREFEALRSRVDELLVRLQNLERRAAQSPGAGDAGPDVRADPEPPGGAGGGAPPTGDAPTEPASGRTGSGTGVPPGP